MQPQIIKRIISRKDFDKYNIPESFGDKAELIIFPYQEIEKEAASFSKSYDLMQAQENAGTINMLNEPEEEAWNAL